MGQLIAAIGRIIPVLWKLFGVYRKFKRFSRLIEGKPKVVSVEAVLYYSDQCECKTSIR
jgi:hypothetical protein